MRRSWIATTVVLTGVAALVAGALTASGAVTQRAVAPSACAFDLRIGDVLPFTGDLAAYGGNLDRSVKLAVDLENKALAAAGLTSAKVELVGSEDGQTQASASVEAATKLVKTQKANVIIGEMASGATIPMAQSVTIPAGVVTLSPTSSAPQISAIKDKGLLWRLYPSDALQGKVLAQAAVDAFGKSGTVNIGARNDAFGTALAALVAKQLRALGGTVGHTVLWNPEQANFDTEAGKLVDGSPAGWVIIDFPDTFQKFAPSLVRTGKWSAAKTLMTEALRNGDVLKTIGDPVVGLRGTAASAAGGPAGKAFAALWKAQVKGAKAYTGFEGTSFDAAMSAFLASVKGCSASPAKIKANLISISGPPGLKVTFANLGAGIKALLAGKEINYEGAFSPVDFDRNGDIGSAVYEIWKNDGNGKISSLKTITFRG
jgi:ABC-type branched-subunit amino acid transport system substrate-binding protein